ncbi:MAG: hypothetical protein O7C61_10285 [SAR324 cluster bacterium]|nr:hypothetical protein [SAR324 cluster bacterium]
MRGFKHRTEVAVLQTMIRERVGRMDSEVVPLADAGGRGSAETNI